MNNEIRSLLLVPENFELALDIHDRIHELRHDIFELFWKEVKTKFSLLLQELSANNWTLEEWEDLRSRDSDLGCWLKTGSNSPAIGVIFKHLLGMQEFPFMGIWRSENGWSEGQNEIMATVQDSLKMQGFRSSGGWIAWRRPSKFDRFHYKDNATLLKVNLDNNNDAHPLAHSVAGDLFRFFAENHQELEKLLEAGLVCAASQLRSR